MTEGKRFVGRAPGRLDLMGGGANLFGSLTVQITTREGVWASIELRDDSQILIFNPQASEKGWAEQAEFALGDLGSDECVRELVKADPGLGWTAHILGAFFLLKEWFPDRVTRGVNVYIKSDAPIGAGLGTSAALEVAVMKTAAYAYGIELAGVELAAACQWVETIIAESARGVVDQVTSVLGDEGRLLPLLCQHCLPRPLVRVPPELRLWGILLGHSSTGVEEEIAQAAGFMAYKLICDSADTPVQMDGSAQIPRWTDRRWSGYLANVTPSLFRSNFEHRLPESLSGAEYLQDGQVHVDPFTRVDPEQEYRVRASARFVVEENQRAKLFADLIGTGAGLEEIGELMYQSHYGYSERGLGCEAADYLVSLVCEEGPASGLYGAKITGGGSGGVVAVLGKRDAEDAFDRVLKRYVQFHGEAPRVLEGSSVGADRFGVLTLGG